MVGQGAVGSYAMPNQTRCPRHEHGFGRWVLWLLARESPSVASASGDCAQAWYRVQTGRRDHVKLRWGHQLRGNRMDMRRAW